MTMTSQSPLVAVFGSARVSPATTDYQAAYQVGKALAAAGYRVITGGYDGVMAAASEGAASIGQTDIIGVTVDDLEAIGESQPNRWLTQEIRYKSLRERLQHIVDHADAYVTMPGGVGTLQELVEVWQVMRLGDIPRRPLIVYGDFWHTVLNLLDASPYINDTNRSMVDDATTPDEVINQLDDWFREQTRETTQEQRRK